MTPYKQYLEQWEFGSYEDYLKNFKIVVPEHFNYAFDVLDLMARETPDARALEWCNPQGEASDAFTFSEISRESNRCANMLQPPWASSAATW